MTRKDTIIIAVLVNTGLLAMLFAMAILTDDEKLGDPADLAAPTLAQAPSQRQSQPIEIAQNDPEAAIPYSSSNSPVDEVDSVINEYVSQGIAYQGAGQLSSSTDADEQDDNEKPELSQSSSSTSSDEQQYVEVTVKRGDALEKIAKANGTTVAAIKKASNLKTERLNIGQVLKVPVGSGKKTTTSTASTTKPAQTNTPASNKPVAESTEPVYYTIKSGDNPWNLSKQFGVKYEDLLKLNGLNEDKARNLKVGDKIRIK